MQLAVVRAGFGVRAPVSRSGRVRGWQYERWSVQLVVRGRICAPQSSLRRGRRRCQRSASKRRCPCGTPNSARRLQRTGRSAAENAPTSRSTRRSCMLCSLQPSGPHKCTRRTSSSSCRWRRGCKCVFRLRRSRQMDQQRSARARRQGRMLEAWRWLIGCGLGRLYSCDSEI